MEFKMAATDQLQFFGGRKNVVVNYSNFTITFTTICRCACDFFKVLLKFKMAAMLELHTFLLAQKHKKIKSEIMCR